MKQSGKNTAALLLAFLIIFKSIFNFLLPSMQLRESLASFLYKQMDVLAAIGSNISTKGISEALAAVYTDEIQAVSVIKEDIGRVGVER